MLREIAKKGDTARFRKVDRGLFETTQAAKKVVTFCERMSMHAASFSRSGTFRFSASSMYHSIEYFSGGGSFS